MRLVTFRHRNRTSAGELVGNEILASTAASVTALLEEADEGLLAHVVAGHRREERLPLSDVELLAPVPCPRRNVFAVGWNYLAHFQEGVAASQRELPDHPTFFTKSPQTVIGPSDPIRYDPQASTQWDYEAEVAMVIGRSGRDITESDATAHIAGFLLANDVTVRDVQRRHGGQWFKGKSFDATCPIGPALVTPDEINGPIEFRLELDGEVLQDASTTQMHFSFARIISELSVGLSLHPGDIVLCGTPEGVGYARTPARWLAPGQELRIVSPQLGELRNRVEAQAR